MDLTPDQEAEARRIYDALKAAAEDDLLARARLLASKPDSQIFGATEFQVRDLVHAIGAKAIEAALDGRKKSYAGCSTCCPTCDNDSKFQRYAARRALTALGEVRLARAYYYCPHCRKGHCPPDGVLGLAARGLTPAARQLVARAGTLTAFAEAAQKVLPQMAGLRVAESTAERVTEAAGAALGAWLREGRPFGPPRPWALGRDTRGRSVAYVSVDATGVGMQGPGGAAAEGRMVDVGLIFDAARPGRCRALAGPYELPQPGAQLRRQAAQVGMERADVWVALTDGGAGLEEFRRVYFPRAEFILDFYHAAEHLNELARALSPGDEARSEAMAASWCHALKHEGGSAALAVLEGLDLHGKKAEVREVHRRVTGHVRANAHRMDYPRYQAEGWLIGSGHVEAACKAVVGGRLKGNGMRWGEAGADAVCHLRALFKSEPGQWEAFWALAP